MGHHHCGTTVVSHVGKTVAHDSKTLKFLAELFELSSVEKYDLGVTYTELAIADAGIRVDDHKESMSCSNALHT